MDWIVYKHTNLVNGLIYIGITCQGIEKRWQAGYRGNPHFYNAIQKYSEENFSHEILFEGLTQEEAFEKEIETIAKYDATNPTIGYNISKGGSAPMIGRHHTEEAKKLFSEQRKGTNNAFYGKHHTKETKEKIAKSKVGKKLSEEHKHKISEGLKGKFAGENNPMYGNHMLAGENNPMYGKRGGKSPNARKVAQYDLNNNLIQIFNSVIEAAQSINVYNGAHISECCKGKRQKCGGYIWKYVDETLEDQEEMINDVDD